MARIQYVARLATDKNSGLPLPQLAGQAVTIVKRGTTTPVTITEDEAGTMVIPSSIRTVSTLLFIPSFWVNEADMPVSALGAGVEVPLDTSEGIAKRLDVLEPQVAAAVSSSAASAASAEASRIAAEAAAAGGGGGGVTAHGALTGLGNDDHTQYHNDARGDARYPLKSAVTTEIGNAVATSSAADRNRANHTGQQAISTITNLQTILDGFGGTAVNSVNGLSGVVVVSVTNLAGTGTAGRAVMGAESEAAGRTALGAAATSHTHTASQITDSTATGRGLLTAADAAAARGVIGAGTSSLELGTTGTTALRGNAIVLNPSTLTGLPVGTFVAHT
ncbi:hypothetical protein [Oerskovia enterophila]|uniref:hypothetical protein n=1 Tax=Oerskovia enterophila TaxID=43678 RepID=UPI00381F8C4E